MPVTPGITATLLPAGVEVVEATPEMYDAPLAPEEERAVADAAPERAAAFRAGRACAREAIRRLGHGNPVIGVRPGGRSPVWPGGLTGAITHCRGFCAAAVAPLQVAGAIGIDAEERGRVSERAARAVCTRAELERIANLGELRELATLAFSAKEAAFKCLNPLTGLWLGFRDAEVDIEPAGDLAIRVVAGPLAGTRIAGRHLAGESVVATAVSLDPATAASLAAQAAP